MDKDKRKDIINPIDKDKITENPHNLPYAHNVGSQLVKPEDQGRVKGRALSAMEFQTDMQLEQIYEQMQLLANQAKKLEERKIISERIYQAEIRFEPIINHVYYFYRKEDVYILSLISPEQWGKSKSNFEYIATVRLLADHTWDILAKNEDELF